MIRAQRLSRLVQHQKRKQGRFHSMLVEFDQSIEKLRPGVAGIVVAALCFATIPVTIETSIWFSTYGFVFSILMRGVGILVLATIAISLALAFAIPASLYLVALLRASFKGLLSDRGAVAVMGGLSGFLATVMYFDGLPILINVPQSHLASWMLIAFAMFACQTGAIWSSVKRFDGAYGEAVNSYRSFFSKRFRFHIWHILIAMTLIAFLLAIDGFYESHWLLTNAMFFGIFQATIMIVDRFNPLLRAVVRS